MKTDEYKKAKESLGFQRPAKPPKERKERKDPKEEAAPKGRKRAHADA